MKEPSPTTNHLLVGTRELHAPRGADAGAEIIRRNKNNALVPPIGLKSNECNATDPLLVHDDGFWYRNFRDLQGEAIGYDRALVPQSGLLPPGAPPTSPISLTCAHGPLRSLVAFFRSVRC